MADRGELLRRTLAAIADEPFALIGGQALLAHGQARQTDDIDLLVGTQGILDARRWTPGDPPVVLRRAEGPDPLDGVAALAWEADDDDIPLPGSPAPVEIIVLDRPWARAMLERAGQVVELAGARIPVVDLADLAILKAYADGPVDRTDIATLAERSDWAEIRRLVESRLPAGPPVAARSWKRLMRILDA